MGIDDFVRLEQRAVLDGIRNPKNRNQFELACTRFYLAYKQPLRNCLARRFGHDPDAVDEIVQRCFWRSLRIIALGVRIDDTKSLLPWLLTIGKRAFYDRARGLRVRRRHADEVAELQRDGVHADVDPQCILRNSEVAKVIDAVLGRLHSIDPRLRDVLYFRDVVDLDSGEVAERLGISVEEVYRTYYAAKQEVVQLVLEMLIGRNPKLYNILTLTLRKRLSTADAARKLGLSPNDVDRWDQLGKKFVRGYWVELVLGQAPDWIWHELHESVTVVCQPQLHRREGEKE